MEGF
ncbi:hypothetical protein R3I94_008263 [Phoxinus phoxinus]|jgi:hypothetical protein